MPTIGGDYHSDGATGLDFAHDGCAAAKGFIIGVGREDQR
jgi:hypothetical protein